MKLPAHPQGGIQIGISDILAWRDCATRMQFGMRRHEGGEAPESWSPQNAYGSAIHDCLQALDDGALPEDAAQAAFARFKQWLEPRDLTRLYEDMEKYLARDLIGVRTLLNESEISIRLFEHPAVGQVWFRARIDRLYQALDDPARLIHIDYKSSKWAKSEEEVNEDLQLWSYNLAIFEWFTYLYPEIEGVQIEQIYDQLVYGQIPAGRKGPEQREEIRRWLIAAVTAIVEDETAKPTYNQWCPWCPLKMDCPVVQFQLTDWATARIAALMPREQRINQDGSESKRQGPVKLDEARLAEYVELLPDVKRAAKVLSEFAEEVGDALKQMPDSELHLLGKKKTERSRRVFTNEAKREIIELVGLPTFLMLAKLSLTDIERYFSAEKELAVQITALADKRPGALLVEDI